MRAKDIGLIACVFAIAIFALWALGRPLGSGSMLDLKSSQAWLDGYSVLHVEFGVLWAGVMWITSKSWPQGRVLVSTACAAAGWEIVENTPFMIARFATHQAYDGDSLLNASGDMLCVLLGCWLARRLRMWPAIGLMLALETIAAWMLRDNLVIGAILLMAPWEPLLAWRQALS